MQDQDREVKLSGRASRAINAGIQSLHVASFSPVSHSVRYRLSRIFQRPARESCLERSTEWGKSAVGLSSDRFRVAARPS